MTSSLPRITIIAGPTASGKSALALDVAKKSGGVIINADSQQMYAELRVLTARPTAKDEAELPHRLYGCLSVAGASSVGNWLQLAKMEIDWARDQGQPPIVTGGTGLYIKALIEGLAEIPAIAPAIRAQASRDLEAMGHAAFHERLKEVDPVIAGKLRPTDTQRLIRAYEVWLGSGKPLSHWQSNAKQSYYNKEIFDVVKVNIDRDILYQRCNERFEIMFSGGAIEEVEMLLAMKLSPDLPAMRIIGVPEISAYLHGEISREEAINRAQQATRNYAKRQLTWFRNQL